MLLNLLSLLEINGTKNIKEGDKMANISEEKWIEMLEKKADGSYIAKYPKIKSKSGVTFDELLTNKISAGTGLLGGGDLSRDRELKVNFGTGSAQVAKGNHEHSEYIRSSSATGEYEFPSIPPNGTKTKTVYVSDYDYLLIKVNATESLILMRGYDNTGVLLPFLHLIDFPYSTNGDVEATITKTSSGFICSMKNTDEEYSQSGMYMRWIAF